MAKIRRKGLGRYPGSVGALCSEVNREGYHVPNEGQQRIIASIIDMPKDRWPYREI